MRFGRIKKASGAMALTMAVVSLAGNDPAGASTAAGAVSCNIVNRVAIYGLGGYSYSRCTGSATYYRVHIVCVDDPLEPAVWDNEYGPWQHTTNPVTSWAFCDSDLYYSKGWTEFA